jgi:hypothetical protein
MGHINSRKRVSSSANVNPYSTGMSEIENRRKAEKSDPPIAAWRSDGLGLIIPLLENYVLQPSLSRVPGTCLQRPSLIFLSSYIFSNFLQLVQITHCVLYLN